MSEFRLGMQSYTFRNFKTLDEAIGLTKKAGLSYMELFSGHLSCDADDATVQAGLDKLKAAGITPDSYGVHGFSKDEAANRRALGFAKKAGIKALSADIEPDAVGMAESLSKEYNVRLAIHNHGINHRYGTVKQLKELFGKTGANIGLCLDTAWMLQTKTDPVKAAKIFGERLYGVHLKDFVFAADSSPKDVVLGEGGLKLEQLFQALDSMNFSGYLSIEYEGEPDDPLPAVLRSVAKIKKVLGD